MPRIAPADWAIIERILAPSAPIEKHGMVVNEGFRYCAFGKTKSGKTSIMRAVVYSAIAMGYAKIALVHDTKGIFPEYPHSVMLPNVAAFRRRGVQGGDIPVYSFRGDPRRDVPCPAEEVAALAKELGQKGTGDGGLWLPYPTVTVIEELAEASTASGKALKAQRGKDGQQQQPAVAWLAFAGRKVGNSLVATTQRPKKAAEDVITQASATTYGRLEPADINYLADRLDLPGALVDAVRGPDGDGLPPHHFVLRTDDAPWDGQIHCLDRATVAMFE